MVDKKSLPKRDICTKFITPAINKAGWDMTSQVREEFSFTDERIYVRSSLTTRGKRKRADYILYYHSNIPLSIIEANDNNHSIQAGMQQALEYTRILDVPCVFSINGNGFEFQDQTGDGDLETKLTLNQFPAPAELWEKHKRISNPDQERIASQDYYFDFSGRMSRYYQQIAINRTVEAITRGRNRIYNRTDFDRNLVIEERRKLVAQKAAECLKSTDHFSKTIAFCQNIEHDEHLSTAVLQEIFDG